MTFSPNMRWVEIQERETTIDPTYGTNVEGAWTTILTVKAEVQDMLPSRAERIADGINIANRPCRVRFKFRDGLSSVQRFLVKGRGPDEADRVLNVVAGPTELGFRDRVEFVAEQMSTEGQQP